LSRRLADASRKGWQTILFEYAQLKCPNCGTIFMHKKTEEKLKKETVGQSRYTRKVMRLAIQLRNAGKSCTEIQDELFWTWHVAASHRTVMKWINNPGIYGS